MLQLTDEELIKFVKKCEGEIYTLAEIHKILIKANIASTIEELRMKIFQLYQDGYIGKERDNDGVNMYYIIFNPAENTSHNL